MKVTVSFRNELDTRAAEKTQSDERLKQDMQHLMIQVHQKFVDVDTAVATISSTQPTSTQIASQPQAAPQLVPQFTPSATVQPSHDPWAAAAAQSRMSDTLPQGGLPTPQSETLVQCGRQTLDRPQEAGFGHET